MKLRPNIYQHVSLILSLNLYLSVDYFETNLTYHFKASQVKIFKSWVLTSCPHQLSSLSYFLDFGVVVFSQSEDMWSSMDTSF